MVCAAMVFLPVSGLFATAQIKTTKISGDLSFLHSGDTVEITLRKYPDLPYSGHFFATYTTRVTDHSFNFSFPGEEPFTYLTIGFKDKNSTALSDYIIQAGAEIHISDVSGAYVFSGRSSGDFELQRKIRGVTDQVYGSLPKSLTPGTLAPYLQAFDRTIPNALKIVAAGKGNENGSLDDVWKANIIYGMNYQKYAYLGAKLRSQPDSLKLAFRKSYLAYRAQQPIDWDTVSLSDQSRLHSSGYSSYVLAKYFTDSCVFKLQPLSEHAYLEYVRQNYREPLSWPLSMYLILSRLNRTKDNLEPDIDRLLEEIRDPDFHRALLNIKQVNFASGALPYTLTDEKGQQVNLSRYLGKVVVLDFYYTGCGNCRILAPVLRQVEERFQNKDVVFIAISIDKSRSTWLASVKSQLYSSPLSVNLYTSGKGTNDPIIKGLTIEGYPTLLLIDKKGRLMPNFNDPRKDKGADLEKTLAICLSR